MAKKRSTIRPISPVRVRKAEPHELAGEPNERLLARLRELEDIRAEARRIANDPKILLQFLLVALHVAELHPPFAQELLHSLKGRMHATRSIQASIRRITKAKRAS
jgi:hypothetical protein